MEKLILKKDSTFEYQVTGDVIHKRGKEFYKITYRKLNLIYQFDPIDTTGTAYLTSLGFPVEDDRKSWIASFPRLFFIRNGKLLSTDINGKIIRRARIKSLYQKPLKKYYLKQIDSIIGNL